MGQVVIHADRVGDADARKREALLLGEIRQVFHPPQAQRMRSSLEQASLDQGRHVGGSDRAIGNTLALVLDLHQRFEPDHAA